MKKHVLKSSLLAGLLSLLTLLTPIKSELKDITSPHLGFYECENATLSGEDLLDKFDHVRLELKADENFVLYYATKDGKENKETGKYSYDRKKEEIRLSAGERNGVKRTFPLKDGVIFVTLRIGGKTLRMQFKQK